MSPTNFRRAAARAALPTLLAGALVATVPALIEAQQTGTITGTVRSATNGQPLAGAQVSIPAINAGIMANNVGRYLIPNIPVGTHTVTVTFIGYETVEAEVTVTAGGAAVENFEMRSEAISLEGVVVTGTAGAARRREIGNSVSQLNAEVFESSPVVNVADILQGRALGATVLTNGGQVGAGSTIKLRGNNSVSFSNSPLVYVDGVRIRERGMVHSQEANQQRNPFDDINPADIERIETIKGAAATTLYGTEAAGGVIQIFTKRGVAGAPAWSLTVDQGLNTLGHIGPSSDVNPTGLGLNNCNFTGDDNFPGGDPMFPADPSCPEGGDWLKNGAIQNYNLSVRGGAQRMNYFMSANWGNEEGVFDTGIDDNGVARPTQGVETWRLRGNFAFAPSDAMDVRFNTSYAHRDITWVPDGNNAEGLLLNVFRGGSDYTNDSDGKLLDMGVNNIADHFTSGMNVTWTPMEGMSHRVNAGIDWNRDTYFENRPWGYFYVQGGNRETVERTYRYLTLDYAGQYDNEIFGLSSSFSVGGQLYNNFITGTSGDGRDFAGPGAKVLQSGAITSASEANSTVTSGGFFLQEVLGLSDKLFLTLGLRVDGHSTFGQDFGLEQYPKASFSYVISDEDFYPASFGTLKLRGAFGESGKAPGLFDATRTWSSVAGDNGRPGVTPSNLGNANLGPERTREWEVGFEGTTFNDRITFEYQYFDQNTFDALIDVVQLPSGGFVGDQLENVGQVTNAGHEAFVGVNLLATNSVIWDTNVRMSTNRSRVIDLGGLESINLGWRNYVRAPVVCTADLANQIDFDGNGFIGKGCEVGEKVYFPLPAFCHDRVQNPDEVGAPDYEEQCLGPTTPTMTYGIGTSATFFQRLTFDVLGEGVAGQWLSSGTAYQNARRRVWPLCRETVAAIADGRQDQLTAGERALCDRSVVRYGMWTQPSDFFKLRSASVSYRVPDGWLPGQIRGATIRLQGRNLLTFTDFEGVDPEAFEDGSAEVLFRQEYYNLPPMRSFLLSVKVDF
ncbi:MAG: SusC/RagA family TonB-linked outer membrane protein [Gemmatimonadota bacterium]|nr:SusC/RagA family TonB-linked outer membrane protein [Gemmatimonadota bacterium]